MQKNQNKDLTELNSFGIKQYADLFFSIEDKSELHHIDFSRNPVILGGGSNVLITKRLPEVIHISNKGIEILSETRNDIILRVQAGEIWDTFVKFCVRNNYYGAENLSFIPGTVGAAPIQNIGAYGSEAKDIIHRVEFFDIENKEFKVLSNRECNFGYRASIFKNQLKGKVVITSVDFKLSKVRRLNLSYKGLDSYFSSHNEITLQKIRTGIIEIRKAKLPAPFILGNAGSFFKNAIVQQNKIDELSAKYDNLPYFYTAQGLKIPTAYLIEKAGLKGYKMNKAAIYYGHSLIIVNLGGASAEDIINLSDFIEEKINSQFGIKIEKEVNII